MDLFSNFLLLVVRVNKYQSAVLKILVYQVHLWNLAKTAFVFVICDLVCLWVKFMRIWKYEEVF